MGLSIGNYEANLTIEGFRGVMQYDENESINTDMRYAADAKNFDTRDGDLLPLCEPIEIRDMRDMSSNIATIGSVSVLRIPKRTGNQYAVDRLIAFGEELHSSAVSLVVLNWKVGSTTAISPSFIGPTGQIDPRFSSVQYEIKGLLPDPEERIPALIFSNKTHGMYSFAVNPDFDQELYDVVASAPYKFGVLARYGERIWGADIEGYPDLLVYSAPYDATDWAQNVQIPEDGAGEIQQPTFDGERFTALVPFGNSLLAFKEHSLWRITGLSPDEFTFNEQYGTGTIYPNTIVVYQEAVYFLTDRGVCRYDGVTVRLFQAHALQSVWRDHPLEGIDPGMPAATIWHDHYILSFPDSTSADHNNKTIVYDFQSNTWSGENKKLHAIAYATVYNRLYLLQPPESNSGQDTQPTKILEWYGSRGETATADLTKITKYAGFDWLTPWSDMGAKDIVKNEYKLRFWIQTHMKAGDKLKLSVTLETERGEKTREILFDRDVDEEVKMRFHLSGRRIRMRFKLTDQNNNEEITSWCKIMGGVQLKADTSPD